MKSIEEDLIEKASNAPWPAPATRATFGRRLQTASIVAPIAMAAFLVLGQADPLAAPMRTDSGMFAYIASHLLRGETLYMTAWDHKPPLVYFINAGALLIGDGTRWGIWAMELLFLLGAALTGFAAMRRMHGIAPALLASLFWIGCLGTVLQQGNFTEEYSLLFSFAALWLFAMTLERAHDLRLHLMLGIAFGLGFLTRPNNAGVQASILAVELVLVLSGQWQRRSWKGLLTAVAGFIIPVAVAAAYFALRGAWRSFLEASFIYNTLDSQRPDLLQGFAYGIIRIGYPGGIAFAGMALAFGQLARQIRTARFDPTVLWLCIDFPVEVFFAGLSGRHFTHYYICWLPWMAVATSLLASRALPGLPQILKRFPASAGWGAMMLVAMAGAGPLADYARTAAQLRSGGDEVQFVEEVPAYIREHTQPGETVFIWGGMTGNNYLAGRDSPSAFYEFGTLAPNYVTERLSAEFMRDVRDHAPKLIVDMMVHRVPPISEGDPVAWSMDHLGFVPPRMQEFVSFARRRYVHAATVGTAEIYVLQP